MNKIQIFLAWNFVFSFDYTKWENYDVIAPVAALEAVSITQLLIKNYQPQESTRKAEQNLSDKLKPENFDDEVIIELTKVLKIFEDLNGKKFYGKAQDKLHKRSIVSYSDSIEGLRPFINFSLPIPTNMWTSYAI